MPVAPATLFPATTHGNNLVSQVTVPLGWLPTTSPGRGHSRSQQDPEQGTKTQTQARRFFLSRSRGGGGDGTLASHLPTVEGDTSITLLCVSLHSEERQDIKQGLDPRVGTTSQKHRVLPCLWRLILSVVPESNEKMQTTPGEELSAQEP